MTVPELREVISFKINNDEYIIETCIIQFIVDFRVDIQNGFIDSVAIHINHYGCTGLIAAEGIEVGKLPCHPVDHELPAPSKIRPVADCIGNKEIRHAIISGKI